MICVVIKGPSFEEAYCQIDKALEEADLIELRLDFFSSLDFESLKQLRFSYSIPMIFTLRSSHQGGKGAFSEEHRIETLLQLATLQPDYIDLESHISLDVVQKMMSQFPAIKWILSHHNLENTPSNQELERLFTEIKKKPASFYKMAFYAQNELDALRLLCWAKQKQGSSLIAISMGVHGQISRVIAPLIGCSLVYACLEEADSILGQISVSTLVNQYHYRQLNQATALYGLIGDPINRSISEKTHNALIKVFGWNAVYVKIAVKESELAEFIPLAKQLRFKGLSVTMPLKEAILPFLDQIDLQAESIGAVNTLVFDDRGVVGFNTDGSGALAAIEKKGLVYKKTIVILGAGGAAKAIAYEALQRGAKVTVVNRNVEKAEHLAQSLKCNAQSLEKINEVMQLGCDVLINCTPCSLPISLNDLKKKKPLVMDITTMPKETAFLKQAIKEGCPVIYGYEMFVEQAIGQFSLWFKKDGDVQKMREALEQQAENQLVALSLTTHST